MNKHGSLVQTISHIERYWVRKCTQGFETHLSLQEDYREIRKREESLAQGEKYEKSSFNKAIDEKNDIDIKVGQLAYDLLQYIGEQFGCINEAKHSSYAINGVNDFMRITATLTAK